MSNLQLRIGESSVVQVRDGKDRVKSLKKDGQEAARLETLKKSKVCTRKERNNALRNK